MERREAKHLGLKKYRTGYLCIYGHDSERYTSNGACCECARLDFAADYQADPERLRERGRRNYARRKGVA